MFEWDEAKAETNLRKHGIDFRRAMEIWAGPYVVIPGRSVAGEDRSIAIGIIDGQAVAVVHTMRAGEVRIISARRARNDEKEAFENRANDR